MTILDVHQRCLQRARDTLGGLDGLAKYLLASPTSVAAWLSGVDPVPDFIFLRVVDLLLDEVQSLEEWNTILVRAMPPDVGLRSIPPADGAESTTPGDDLKR